MNRPESSTPAPNKADRDALSRLDEALQAFEVERRKPPSLLGVGGAAGAGYRVLGQLLSGVLGGVGLGWLMDHFAHTRPWGVVIGVFGGAALSIYSTVRMAGQTGAPSEMTRTKGSAPGSRDEVQARENDG